MQQEMNRKSTVVESSEEDLISRLEEAERSLINYKGLLSECQQKLFRKETESNQMREYID